MRQFLPAPARIVTMAAAIAFMISPLGASADGPCPAGDPERCDEAQQHVNRLPPPPPEVGPLIRVKEAIEATGDEGYQPPLIEFDCSASLYVDHGVNYLAGTMSAVQAQGAGACHNEFPVGIGTQYNVICSLRLDVPVQTPFDVGGKSEVQAASNEHGRCPFPFTTDIIYCVNYTPIIATMYTTATQPPSSVWLAHARADHFGTC